MANALGSLVVRLGLDHAEYTRGLTKAEYQAQQFARNMRTTIADVAAVIGGLELGREVVNATTQIIAEAAALNDLSSATGSTVEALSRLNNQAKISGTDFKTFESALLKLSAGMSGVDDKSAKTRETLALLGVTAKDPVEALQQAAVKLSTYADGVNKVGLAQRLLGGSGREFIKTLQDIADLQDVGATVTKKQAQEAEALEQAFRRLTLEAKGFRDAILDDVVPALLHLIRTFNDARNAAGTFGQGLEATFSLLARGGNAADQLAKVNEEIKKVDESLNRDLKFRGLNQLRDFLKGEQLANLLAQRAVLEKQVNESTGPPRPPIIKPPAPDPPGPVAKAGAARQSEAERYLKTLEETLARTNELTTVEQVIREIQVGRLKDASHLEKDRALGFAQQIDAFKALEKELEASKKAWDDETRAVLDNLKAKQDAARNVSDQAENARKTNAQLRDEIAIIVGGEGAREALAKDYADAAIQNAQLEQQMRIALGATEEEAAAFDDLIDQLVEYRELLNGKSLAEQMQRDAKAIQDVKNAFSDAVADPLADFISGTKTAKEAFKSFVDDVSRQIARLAAQNIANAIFGGNNSGGPDYFGLLMKLGMAWFGGTTYMGGVTDSVPMDIGLGANAMGTRKWRGGWTMVGEHGPELLNAPAGSSITPNHSLASVGGGTVINQTINVLPGASRQTGYQAAREAARQVTGAVKR